MKEHIDYYQRLLSKDPNNVDARLRLGAVWRSLGRKAFAVEQYSAAARQLARDGLLLEAIAACKAIFELEPSHTETQLFLASLYARQPTRSGTVARVVKPSPTTPAPHEESADEVIVLEPKDAVEEMSAEDLEDAIIDSYDEAGEASADEGEPEEDDDAHAPTLAGDIGLFKDFGDDDDDDDLDVRATSEIHSVNKTPATAEFMRRARDAALESDATEVTSFPMGLPPAPAPAPTPAPTPTPPGLSGPPPPSRPRTLQNLAARRDREATPRPTPAPRTPPPPRQPRAATIPKPPRTRSEPTPRPKTAQNMAARRAEDLSHPSRVTPSKNIFAALKKARAGASQRASANTSGSGSHRRPLPTPPPAPTPTPTTTRTLDASALADPDAEDGAHYPDRVLRRALNLAAAWSPGSGASEPATIEIPDALLDTLKSMPEEDDEDEDAPLPGEDARKTVSRSDSWPKPIPNQPPKPKPWPNDATRVATVHTENTVLAPAPTSRPNVNEALTLAAPIEALPRPATSKEVTRVARPNPGVPPIPPPSAPTASSPSYDRLEVISPAALSVSRGDLPHTPLFSRLTPRTFMDLLKRIDLRRVPAGENIIDDQVRPIGLFIIVNGQVDIMRALPDGTTKHLATMGRGEFFGEFELLTGRSHSAIVRAVDAVDLLEVSDEVIADLAENDPTIWDVLWDFYHQRLLNNLLATSTLFRSLPPHDRTTLARRFERLWADRGEVIVSAEDGGSGLFLILSGVVDVIHAETGAPIMQLSDGEFFGTISAMTGEPTQALVRAAEECTLLILAREHLLEVAARNPRVRETLDSLVEERRLLMGQTGYARMGHPK